MLTEIHMQTLTAQVHANTFTAHMANLCTKIPILLSVRVCVCECVSAKPFAPIKVVQREILGTFGCNIKKHQAFFPPFH